MILGGRARFIGWTATAAAALLALPGCGGGGSAGSSRHPTLNWYVFNEPGGAFKQAAADCTKQAKGAYKISIVALPTDADQQRELIVRRLAAKDKSVDIIGMDVIWTAEFGEAGWIEPWTGANEKKALAGAIPATVATARYKGKLFAAPFTSNTQVLFYRKDRVKRPPKTWDEMFADAKRIGAQGKVQVQGARYEGLTVWFNSLVASAGGSILDRGGNVKLGKPAVDAARVMKTLASSSAAPAGLQNNKEDQARLGFEAGDSSFEINYTFAYASANSLVEMAKGAEKKKAQDFVKNIGVARWPSVAPGQPSHVTLGGINLGVGSYGKHKDLAFRAATCLKNDANQLVATQKGGLLPTSSKVFDSPALKKALPFVALLKATIKDGVARPVTPAYSDVSQAVQRSLHPEPSIDPQNTIDDMKGKLKKAKDGKIF